MITANKGSPKLDEDEDSKVIQFIDQYITCSLPMKNKYSELNDLVKTLQSHHDTQTCRRKKGVICKFKVPWPVTNETLIIRKTENPDKSKISKN